MSNLERQVCWIAFSALLISLFVFTPKFLVNVKTAKAQTITVPAGSNDLTNGANFQTALNNAQCGDTIVLQAGGTYSVGNTPFILPNKNCAGPNYLTITGSAALPTVCQILTATCRTGWISTATNFPKLISKSQTTVISSSFAASYYKFQGIEIASTVATHGSVLSPTLVIMGEDASNSTGSYIYAHVNSELPHHITFDQVYLHGTPTGDLGQAIIAEGNTVVISNSYIEDVHVEGTETHGIQVAQANGPLTVTNNYISASGMCFMSGGNGDTISQNIPTGLLFQDNYCTRKVSWYTEAASVGGTYGGIPWSIKNCFELKKAKNATINHNVFENSWTESQPGTCILMQVSAQYAAPCPGCFGGTTLNCDWCTITNVTFTNNIVRHAPQAFDILGSHPLGLPTAPLGSGLNISNNLVYDISPKWGGAGLYSGNWCLQTAAGFKNITVDHMTCDNDGRLSNANPKMIFYNTNTSRSASDNYMTNYTVKNSFMRQNSYGLICNGSGYGTSCLNEIAPGPTWTFTKNVLGIDVPWITYPATNDQPTNAALSALWTDPAIGTNDDAVDYSLKASSVYKLAGTDGKDIGADVSLLPGSGVVTPPPPPPTPVAGDLNLDHIVNSLDWSIMNSKWFTTDANADLNHDGLVNAIDFSILNSNWFKTW